MNRNQLALILIRVTLGVTMALHGIQKFTAMAGTIQFFESLGLPSFMPYIIATIELGGGLLLIFGILAPLVALGFIAILTTAIFMLKSGTGFVGGYELELILILMSISVLISHFELKWIILKPKA